MSRPRTIPLLFLACFAFLLTGALADQPSPPAPTPQSDFVPESPLLAPVSQVASSPLDEAIIRLSPARTRWLELTILQKGKQDDTSFEAQSHCIVGPDNLLRWDMRVQVGKTVSRQRVVSNGRLLWLGRRIADCFPTGELLILPTLTGGPNLLRQQHARHKLLAEKGFVTLETLLTNVRDHLERPLTQTGTWKGKPVLLVTGSWRGHGDGPNLGASATGAKRCNVYFDKATRLPFRLEWVTDGAAKTTPVVLWEMEIRKLVVNRPLPPEGFAHTFSFTSLYN